MSLSQRNVNFENLIGVLLRIPPVFILDQLFKVEVASNNDNSSWLAGALYGGTFILLLTKSLLLIGGSILSATVILLNTHQLLTVYIYATSILCVYFSYWLNNEVVTMIANKNTVADVTRILSIFDRDIYLPVFSTLSVQLFLWALYQRFYNGPFNKFLLRIVLVSFVTPTLLSFFPFPTSVLLNACMVFATLPLAIISAIIFTHIPSVAFTIEIALRYCKDHVLGFGIASFIELEWSRIKLPYVLRIFWLSRFIYYSTVYWNDPLAVTLRTVMPHMNEASVMTEMAFRNGSLTDINWVPPEADLLSNSGQVSHSLKWLLITGCDNGIAVLGLTSVVAHICNFVGILFREILMADDDEKNVGTVAAILFFILSLQTGLTGLAPEKRYVRLCRNFYLLFTAILHIIHSILYPVLMSLSASHNSVLHRHARALAVSVFLIVYPLAQLAYLWHYHSLSTWLLAVSAFSIEVVIKVIISLVIYALFLADSYKSTFWEELDDYVYYIRATGSTIEFCFGIFLFFNGTWILVFESGGAVRALMMGVHAYFNIWCEAKTGWVTFIKRRTAVKKINTLPDATAAELEEFSDVCSICYQQMKSAKITTCKHYFHAVCLRKWLYLQDHCPLCHTVLYRQRVNTAVYDLDRRYAVHPQLPGHDNNVNDGNDEQHVADVVFDQEDQGEEEDDEEYERENGGFENNVILTFDTNTQRQLHIDNER